MTDDTERDYLWDRSGEPDPDVVRLEALLGTLRHEGAAPALPARTRPRRAGTPRWLAAAAGILLVAGAVWLVIGMRRGAWDVHAIEGKPVVDGRAFGDSGRLAVGDWLVTDAVSRASVAVARIGRVVVFPNTRVQLVESKGREHRMALERGTIHARIWAPPKFFYVNTPAAVAIDLGCEYTLQVDDAGAGLLRVTQGWVAFEGDGRESFIPQGAMGATRPGAGPGTPWYEDAPSGYAEALAALDFGPPDDAARAKALDHVLTSARRRDALTLWHLLARGSVQERGRVYDRLAALAPPPQGVTRDGVLAGDRRMRDMWWDGLGVNTGSWWKIFKKL